MSDKAVELLDVYTNEVIKQEEKQQPFKAAKVFSDREKEYKEKSKSDGQVSNETKMQRRMTLAPETLGQRPELFKTNIEQVTIGLKELLKALTQSCPITVGSFTIFPQAYLFDKVTEKISEKIKSFMQFPVLPSKVKFLINTYKQMLINLDLGFDVPTILKDIMFDLRYLIK